MELPKELEGLKQEVPEFRSLDVSRIYIKRGSKAISGSLKHQKKTKQNFLFFLGDAFANLFPLSPLFCFFIILIIWRFEFNATIFIILYAFFILVFGLFLYPHLHKIDEKELPDIESKSSFDYIIVFLNKKTLAHELAHILLHKSTIDEMYFEGFWGGFKWWFFNVDRDLEVIDLLKKYNLNISGKFWFLQYVFFKWYQIIGNLLNKFVPIK